MVEGGEAEERDIARREEGWVKRDGWAWDTLSMRIPISC